ncbi:hypothetical protein [Erysipelothrix anatis]|uniref:hypothetical protein n=1 Tax=Erysipelothrix anatis TaxID=2683713 RepID=UPI0013570B47|nr:hypothetical protein [Erysipelothrix anatis]
MFSEKMDERMIMIRGKGLLFGFFVMIGLIVFKNFAVDLLGVSFESATRIDFVIIYVSLFTVVGYMLLHDGVTEAYIERMRYIFLTLSLLLVSMVLVVVVQGEAIGFMPFFTNSMGLIVQTCVTVSFTILVFRKYASLRNIDDV